MATTIDLWLKHRMKHISSRGPYLSSRKAANSASILSPSISCSSLHLWNELLIFILVFSLARSNSLYLHCFSLSVFLFLLIDVDNGGAFFGSVVVCSPPLCELGHIWSGKSKHCTCVGEGHFPVHTTWGRGTASSVCMRMTDTSQTLPLALIGCIDLGTVDSSKSNYSHWVVPQTVDFYTADLYLILLSDQNETFSKYNQKIVTDYSF